MKYFSIIVWSFFLVTPIQGQNLVRNGDFEEYYSLPTTISQLHNVKYWDYKIGRGTPDYFHTQATDDSTHNRLTAGAPGNWFGFQKPHSGEAYVGIITTIAKDERITSEFIQTKLKRTLEKGKEYYVEFYVSIPEGNGLDGLGVFFSPMKIKSDNKVSEVKMFTPQIQVSVKNMTDVGDGWKRAIGIFTAYGDEQYMLIGNFTPYSLDIRDRFGKSANHFYSSDYYIDDIWVVGLDEQQVIKVYKDVDFKNVLFEFDSAKLLPGSLKELDHLVDFMNDNPNFQVKISGFTDNKGSYKYNLSLSFHRANAVVYYLTQKGIASSRLSYEGFGYSSPVADNISEEGREQNRRVEFHVTHTTNNE